MKGKETGAGQLAGWVAARESEGVKFRFFYFKTYFKYEPNQI